MTLPVSACWVSQMTGVMGAGNAISGAIPDVRSDGMLHCATCAHTWLTLFCRCPRRTLQDEQFPGSNTLQSHWQDGTDRAFHKGKRASRHKIDNVIHALQYTW